MPHNVLLPVSLHYDFLLKYFFTVFTYKGDTHKPVFITYHTDLLVFPHRWLRICFYFSLSSLSVTWASFDLKQRLLFCQYNPQCNTVWLLHSGWTSIMLRVVLLCKLLPLRHVVQSLVITFSLFSLVCCVIYTLVYWLPVLCWRSSSSCVLSPFISCLCLCPALVSVD